MAYKKLEEQQHPPSADPNGKNLQKPEESGNPAASRDIRAQR
jgi:hypothetical protein